MTVAEFHRAVLRKMEYLEGLYGTVREPPWSSFMLPGEEPKRFHGRGAWRRRHERIFWLERELGIIDRKWERWEALPWVKYDPGW